MASSSKDQRPSGKILLGSGGDMISNLPDDVRVHILSLLPTKDAFRTCILSSKWENLWAVVPVLRFQPNNSIWNNNEDPGYVDFIERIFMSHNSDIKELKLFCTPLTDISRFKDWISVVVERNVQVIQILSFDKHLQLPDSLFTCKTLVSLILLFPLQLDVPTSIQFSCLKVLHVDLKSPCSALTEKLFCSSPVLEDLKIAAHYGDNNGRYIYNISSPFLKSLIVLISYSYWDNFKCVVNVDAPILELLEVDNVTSVHYILKNSSALVKARLVSIQKGDHFLLEKLAKLLKSVSCVKNLDLIGSVPMLVFGSASEIKWPGFGNVSHLELTIRNDFDFLSFSRFPVFPNLKHLILFVQNDFASKDLSDLLELAPDLVSLKFHQSSFKTDHSKFNYSEQRVPGCFRACLREFAVSNIDGSESGVNLIKYLLVNAQALKKMSVSVSRKIRRETAKMNELRAKLKELLSMTKYSEDLEFCIT